MSVLLRGLRVGTPAAGSVVVRNPSYTADPDKTWWESGTQLFIKHKYTFQEGAPAAVDREAILKDTSLNQVMIWSFYAVINFQMLASDGSFFLTSGGNTHIGSIATEVPYGEVRWAYQETGPSNAFRLGLYHVSGSGNTFYCLTSSMIVLSYLTVNGPDPAPEPVPIGRRFTAGQQYAFKVYIQKFV